MKQEYMESAERVMTFIKKVETEIGPRLPASPEERKGAELIRAEYEKNIGLKTIDEPFKVAPKSSVGAMPYIGLATLVAFVLSFAFSVLITSCLIHALRLFGLYFEFMYEAWVVAAVGGAMSVGYTLIPLALCFKKGYNLKKV